MKARGVSVLSIMIPFMIVADTFTWSGDSTKQSLMWADSANWSGGVAPVNITAAFFNHDFSFPETYSGVQTVVLTNKENNFYANKIVSQTPYVFKFKTIEKNPTFHIKDPSGLNGFICTENGCRYSSPKIRFYPTSTFIPYLPLATVQNRFNYLNQEAGTVAKIGTLFGVGSFSFGVKDSKVQSTIEVEDLSVGLRGSPVQYSGAVVYHGYTKSATSRDELLSKASLHLDANVDSSITESEGSVIEWADVRDNGITAVKSGNVAAPVLKTDSYTGRKVMSFGALASSRLSATADEKARDGQPSRLDFNKSLTGIKEAFFVFNDNSYRYYYSYIFGAAGKTENKLQRSNKSNAFKLFNTGMSHLRELDAGDIRLENTRIMPDQQGGWYARPNVISVGLAGETTIDYLAYDIDSEDKSYLGGVSIGEVLLYTNELTSAERTEVNLYLMEKWCKGLNAQRYDLGTVRLCQTNEISVADGEMAIRRVSLPSNKDTFVKSGDGSLHIDWLNRNDVKISIKGGTLSLGKEGSLVDQNPLPPNDAYYWFDASDISSFDILESNDCQYVVRWHDKRGENYRGQKIYAYRPALDSKNNGITNTFGAYAVRKENTLNGKAVVDFGKVFMPASQKKYGWADDLSGDSACLRITTTAGDKSYIGSWAREAFIVVSKSDDSSKIFNSDSYDALGGGSSGIFTTLYSSGAGVGGVATRDGEIFDTVNSDAIELDKYYVYSLRCSGLMEISTLALDRKVIRTGGVKIAETIVFDRELTEEERINTEAYLLKKWKGVEHPVQVRAKRKIRSLEFAEGVSSSISLDEDTSIVSIKGASDTFTKSGKGDLITHSVGGATGLEVAEGTLKLGREDVLKEILNTAVVHLDASDSESLVLETAPDGETQWVKEWRDVRTNEWSAVKWSLVTNYPALTTVTINGVEKPAVNFYEVCNVRGKSNTDYQQSTNMASAFVFYNSKTAKTTYFLAKECFTVMADEKSDNLNYRMSVFNSDYSSKNAFQRNEDWNGKILRSYSDDQNVSKGVILMDGIVTNKTAEMTDFKYHVISMAPLTEQKIYSIGFFRTGGYDWYYGGGRVCEQIYFDYELDDRTRMVVHNYLRKKWLGANILNTVEDYTDIKLSGGALEIGCDMSFKSGTRFEFTANGDGTWNSIDASGKEIVLPDAGEIVLNASQVSALTSGTVTLLKAGKLTNSDALENWTIVNNIDSSRLTFNVVVVGDSIVLNQSPAGTMVILK